jgi:hypothetical protein
MFSQLMVGIVQDGHGEIDLLLQTLLFQVRQDPRGPSPTGFSLRPGASCGRVPSQSAWRQ